ncbi:MAG: relaxase domain-containing protein, partial [Candidatus Dormibacteraeota bacterium]|nr:relaxase domain-containing protein [Candidatus Dormibacteraeota bacterium]
MIGQGQPAGAAVVYLADPQAVGDYYSEAHRAPMWWSASERARAELGLGQLVTLSAVERLLQGLHPLTGRLLRRFGPSGTMVGALDITVSPAPKSVSILWAMASPELRVRIENMVVGAVAGAVGVVTRHYPLVRERYGPGPNDVRAIKANDVVGLQVLHTTARIAESKAGIPDPQLHVHALQFADLREDGSLRAIESRLFLQRMKEVDGMAQATLAHSLERAGFEIERTPILAPNGSVKRIAWEISGIPPELIKAMSGRSQEISDLARQYREKTGREAIGPGWERFVTARRGAKSHVSREELHALWQAEAEESGYGPEEAALLALQASERAQHWQERQVGSPEALQLRREILRDLCRDHALVPERQLDALAQQRAVGLVRPYVADLVVNQLYGEGELLRTEDGQVTTLEVMAQEQRAERALGRVLQAQPGASAPPERLRKEFDRAEEEGRPFDPEQRQAIALATSGARFVSIAGPAGTGKGWASRTMVNLWREQGRRVFALSVAGRTTQQAAHDSGAQPMTLDALTARTKPRWSPPAIEFPPPFQLRASDMLLVDEAAMIDHERYANLLEVAANAGASITQVGDDHQLNPVGPGGLWTIFHGLAQKQGAAVELREIHRTKDPYEAQAWTDLREGRIEEALTWYRDVGNLRLYDTRPELLQGMVAAWWELNREGVMLVDTSNAERDSLNRMAQAKRLEAGELGEEGLTLPGGPEVRVGDRVLTAKHSVQLDRKLNGPGRRIENGTKATVLELRPQEQQSQEQGAVGGSLVLQLHEPQGDRTVQVDLNIPLELGYARHVMKGQGMTASDKAPSMDAGVSEHTSAQSLYVMLSRSQEGTRVHVLRSELEDLSVNVKELEAAPVEVHVSEPELAEAQLPRESDLEVLRTFSGAQLRPGQVIHFGEQLPLREPSGVEQGELGVVRS